VKLAVLILGLVVFIGAHLFVTMRTSGFARYRDRDRYLLSASPYALRHSDIDLAGEHLRRSGLHPRELHPMLVGGKTWAVPSRSFILRLALPFTRS